MSREYHFSGYDDFRCLAGSCPDSCCQGWAVVVDEETADVYRALPGELGDVLRDNLVREDDVTILENHHGRCPMWRSDGLCRIQCELGADALCQTCTDFPRLQHEYDDFTERQLEMSCPEAARLILTLPPELPPIHETEDEDLALLLWQRREAVRLILDYPLPQSLGLLLAYGSYAQAVVDGEECEPFDPAQVWQTMAGRTLEVDTQALLDFFRNLEILTPQWRQRLDNPCCGNWDEGLRQVAAYLLNRYYLQAISDWDVYSRVNLVVISCILLNTLGGELLPTAQLFSKEIENDPENLGAMAGAAWPPANALRGGGSAAGQCVTGLSSSL